MRHSANSEEGRYNHTVRRAAAKALGAGVGAMLITTVPHPGQLVTEGRVLASTVAAAAHNTLDEVRGRDKVGTTVDLGRLSLSSSIIPLGVQRDSQAVVQVRARSKGNPSKSWEGTGFEVAGPGSQTRIVTAAHVTNGTKSHGGIKRAAEKDPCANTTSVALQSGESLPVVAVASRTGWNQDSAAVAMQGESLQSPIAIAPSLPQPGDVVYSFGYAPEHTSA